jgi:hypothetical protein
MSEHVAARRIGAARAARCFPVIFEMVGRGEIHLTRIHRLKAHLTEDNHLEVLRRARHKTVREIEVLVRELAPLPDVPSRVRALPRRPAELSFEEREEGRGKGGRAASAGARIRGAACRDGREVFGHPPRAGSEASLTAALQAPGHDR